MKPNRTYKDSVFSLYMSDAERLIELYNAIQGTDYPPGTPVEINTLEDALYKDRLNDVSFVIDNRFVVLVEHQASVNENMPVRMLLYIARLYEKLLGQKNIYRRLRIPLQAPEFLVLYNGQEDVPDQQTMKLSESYEAPPHENTVELCVKVLNVKYGHNEPILTKSKSLREYSQFIQTVQNNLNGGRPLTEAIREAIAYCNKNEIMQPFLALHGSEVENMLYAEWNLEEALIVEREEGEAKGMEIGARKARETMIRKMLAEQIPLSDIARYTDVPLNEVERISRIKN